MNAKLTNLCLVVCLSAITFIGPVYLWSISPDWISNTYGKSYELFELFGFFSAVSIAIYLCIFMLKRNSQGNTSIILTVTFIIILLRYNLVFSEYSFKSFDYSQYEKAAIAVFKDKNPYEEATYLYPPLFAQCLAKTYAMINHLIYSFNTNYQDETAKLLLFYTYQSLQFANIIFLTYLCILFGRNLKISPTTLSVILLVLLMINTPITRTLRHNQVNLFVINFLLVSLLLMEISPELCGFFLAIAIHIKVYPLLLLLPLVIMHKFRVILSCIATVILIVGLQTTGFTDFSIYRAFIEFFISFPQSHYYRDTGLFSIVYNFFYFGGILNHHPTDLNLRLVSIIAWVLRLGIFTWFLFRLFKREITYRADSSHAFSSANQPVDLQKIRWYGHFTDTLLFATLLSPKVWEHHYVFIIPVFIWGFTLLDSKNIKWFMASLILINILPITDIFPLSYHRFIGVLILISILPYKKLPSPIPPEVVCSRVKKEKNARDFSE
ncbi:DUF2029 domain-containing protein [bacterium]|nr:DUF2029 domain-containing protein [candidate division CSSED10-310 bacterium]